MIRKPLFSSLDVRKFWGVIALSLAIVVVQVVSATVATTSAQTPPAASNGKTVLYPAAFSLSYDGCGPGVGGSYCMKFTMTGSAVGDAYPKMDWCTTTSGLCPLTGGGETASWLPFGDILAQTATGR